MTTHTRFIALVPAALALALAAGCYKPPDDQPIPGRTERYNYSWLQLGSKDLYYSTMVSDATQSRIPPGDNLRVLVPVRNTTDKQLYVEYKVTFFDANKTIVNEVNGVVTIPSHGVHHVVANSTSGSAESFNMYLGYPRVN